MSALQLFTNNAVSLLDAPLSIGGTSIQVQLGLGALFPSPTLPGEFFLVTLESVGAPFNREIVKISSRTGDILNVAAGGRAQEGTTASAWLPTDTLVDHRITAKTIEDALLLPTSNFGQPNNTAISVGATGTANSLDITGLNKSCKWLVTVQTADLRICMVEILAVYRAAGPIFGQYAKIGDSVQFTVSVTASATDMVLNITNTDTFNFTSVDVIQLQHYV